VAKFAPSRYSDSELPGIVRDVCCWVDADDPLSVSQPRFDAARVDAGHPQAPTAKRICARLHLSWDEAKRLALNPGRNVDRTVGTRTGKEDEPWITDEVCVAALRTVARRIGADEPLAPGRYETEVEHMLAADRRHYLHGHRLVMPTIGQIEKRLGRWPDALVRAGLPPTTWGGSAAGMAWIDAIELCLEATGCLVGLPTLEKFFEANRLSLQRQNPGVSYPIEVEKLRARRVTVGKWTPHRYTTRQERPDLLDPIPGLDGPKRRPSFFDEERAIAAQMQFVRDRRGRSQTRRDYLKWAAGQDDAPAASSMNLDGRPGFAAYREEARRRVLEEENRQR
jgi:hypothetical protein